MSTQLDFIHKDLWNIINEYLFNPEPSRHSIKYLVTIESLSKLSVDMNKIATSLKKIKNNKLVEQYYFLHYLLNETDTNCDVCFENSITGLFKTKNNVQCEKCIGESEFDYKVPGSCIFCYFEHDGMIFNRCVDCDINDNLVKVKHWINDSLVIRYVCERCIINAAAHPSLTIFDS